MAPKPCQACRRRPIPLGGPQGSLQVWETTKWQERTVSSRRPMPESHNCSQLAEVLFFYLLRDSKGGAGPQTSTSRSTWDPSSFVRSLLQTSPWGSKFHPYLPGRVSKPQHTWEETMACCPHCRQRVLRQLASVSGVCTANSNHLESQPDSYSTISEQFLKVTETDSYFKRFSSHFYLMCSVLNSERRGQSPVTLGKHSMELRDRTVKFVNLLQRRH